MKDANEAVSRFLNRKPECTFSNGIFLNGLTAMFSVSEKEEYRQAILDFTSKHVSPEGVILAALASTADLAACGKALFFALDKTHDERYKRRWIPWQTR